MSDFKDKSVIVTGSSSGVGECTALFFASRGANVTVCGQDEARVQQVVEKCRKAGETAGYPNNKVIGVAGDITTGHVREQTIQKSVEAFGKLDIIVVNHGKFMLLPDLNALSEEKCDDIYNANVRSVLFFVKAAMPHLEKTQGCVVVTSSVAPHLVTKGATVYEMSKAAVESMVQGLALEYGPKGIRVNAVKPTVMNTRLFRGQPGDMFSEDLVQFYVKSHPLHGRACKIEEVVDVIAFLAGHQARFVTGECIKVDGGICIKGMPVNYIEPNLPAKESEK